jgi:polyisoprenyl-teichoic acid--peptidoglycan teichoic acid transferase
MSILGDKFYPEWSEYLHSQMQTNLTITEFSDLIRTLSKKEMNYALEEPSGELYHHPVSNKTVLRIKNDLSQNTYNEFMNSIELNEYFLVDSARVEILNGTKIDGLARRVKDTLNMRKYKVLSTENAWTTNLKSSVIINRSGKTDYSKSISKILNIKAVIHSIKKESGLDTIVLLGADFEINH